NEAQKRVLLRKIDAHFGREAVRGRIFAVWGLSFKPNTDDMRFAPSIDVIQRLSAAGATVKAYDPQAMREAKTCLNGTTFCRTMYDAAAGSDCLVVLTEWPQFQEADWRRVKRVMAHPIIVDGRNCLDVAALRRHGFEYAGIGRG
ncbi:MAG: UDP-glucose/GDP-mannose dehydrogenase family protein, partial [Candidatus Omnitrophica bacterium]|nr:UDP-glucose/GDP-mannose dehydrogenase family protein [Candidatus Omnitrophota bacterium]